MERNNLLKEFIILPLMKAWSFFYEVPFPLFREYGSRIDSMPVYKTRVLLFIPVLGALTGIIAYMLVVIMYLLCGDIVTSIIAPILMIIIWEVLNSGKDTISLAKLLAEMSFSSLGSSLNADMSFKDGNFMFFYMFIGLFIIRFMALAFIIYYHLFSWIIIIPVLSLTLQAYLGTGYGGEASEPFFVTDKKTTAVLWTIAGIICFIFAGIHLLSLAITFLLIMLLGRKLKSYLVGNNLLTNDTIGIAGRVSEIIILLTGIILVIHF